jgi:hypothetical protein
MPYKLRKVPKKDLYWVVGEDGKHHSKEGLPLETAKAQMKALYVAMRKEGGVNIPEGKFIKEHKHLLGVLKRGKRSELNAEARDQSAELSEITGGSIDMEKYNFYINRKPMPEDKWIAQRKLWSPDTATPENYREMYLKPFNSAPLLMSQTFVPGVDTAMKCPTNAVNITKMTDEEFKRLPPGTRWCKENAAEGTLSQGTTKTQEQLDFYEKERQQMIEQAKRNRELAEERFYDANPVRKFFDKTVVGALTKVADTAIDLVPSLIPELKPVFKPLAAVYKNFAPPGSEYHKEESLGDKAIKTGSQLLGLGRGQHLHRLTESCGGGGGGHTPSTPFKKQLERAGVSPSAYLAEAQRKAKAKGLAHKFLGFSDDQTHKLQIPNAEGKMVRFGSVGLGDHILYTQSHDRAADEHRRRYLARATKIRGAWAKDPYSANSLAIHILW